MSSSITASTPNAAALPPGWQRRLAFAGIAIASFLGCIDFTIVNTAIPAIQSEFDVGIGAVQWVVTAVVMALCSSTIAAGQLADRHCHRRALFAGMLLFGVASLGAGWASGLAELVAWRLLQGMACAGLYTASAALVASMFPEGQSGRALGLLLSANGLGLAAGPVIGGLLVDTLGWRWIFLLNVPLIGVSIGLCVACLPSQPRPAVRQRFDWLGAMLLSLALPCGIAVAIHGADWGWTSTRTTGVLALGSLLVGILAWVERHAPVPLLRWHWFAQPRFAVAAAATAALAFFYCAAFFMMPLYLTVLRHQDAMSTGWLLLPTTVLMALVSPLAGRWGDRLGTGRVMALGFVALLVSAGMQAVLGPTTGWAWILVAFGCMGVGWGAVLSPSMSAALAAFPPQQAGKAMGMATTVHNLGGVLGLAAATVLHRLMAGSADHGVSAMGFSAGYQAVMLLLALVCVIALLIVLLAGSGRAAEYAGSA